MGIRFADLRDKYFSDTISQHDSAAIFGYAPELEHNALLGTGVLLKRDLGDLSNTELDDNSEFGQLNRSGTASALHAAKMLAGTSTVIVKISANLGREVSILSDGSPSSQSMEKWADDRDHDVIKKLR